MLEDNRAHRWLAGVVVLASITLGVGGCGNAAPVSSEEQRQAVAEAYAIATVEQRDPQAALVLSPGRSEGIDFEIREWRDLQIRHVVGGPGPCPEDSLAPVPEPCYAFDIEGDPIPDSSRGFARIYYGELSIAVTERGRPPTVIMTGYMGGARHVETK